ncbi:hypothetical protein TNCV_2181451 [Trichonephila clavipes]|uniref:Uncharacterized protein n=1 Tax=Trichonephila clavipes TaxID=2585209 RepID=A0A8X6VUW4_TRICX|nr:hypothetical protein TNCV_2181451 [Trichonephila clavipes]
MAEFSGYSFLPSDIGRVNRGERVFPTEGTPQLLQDGVPPHITTPVKQLLITHFVDERIINRYFLIAWKPHSHDENLVIFGSVRI